VGDRRRPLEDVGLSMRVLVTGHDGYIGHALVPQLLAAGHEVTGLDSFLFEDCGVGPGLDIPAKRLDIRDVVPEDLAGFDAVIHLAGISNDPLGDLNPECTYQINHRGAVNVAQAAKLAGVTRFLFSSSCSLYGAAGDAPLDETADFNPVTPYGQSKVLAEAGIGALASDDFTPTFLRNATAYGMSTRLRGDLVVNNLVGFAATTGEVLLKSDGSPLRPLVHIDDISAAFVAILHAPQELVHNQAFNVGLTAENYRIKDVAAIVEEVVPGSRISFAAGAGPDLRNYRVNCDRIAETLPEFAPRWTVRRGAEQVFEAVLAHGLTIGEFTSSRFLRIKHVTELLARGRLDDSLRWATRPTEPLLAGVSADG
jgi:nucleoside-diphosphate-sugar epimerase